MDKVLARDADERYQKSDEFGRDISKAVENMPAAVAAQAGTMVMGAAPAELPKTRMAPKGGATAKLEAAAPVSAAVTAPAAKKSPVMMIAAAVVVIAAIGGGALMMKGKSPAAATPSGAAAPAPQAKSDSAMAKVDGKSTAPADPKQAGAKAQVTPMGKPLTSSPTSNPTAPAPAPTDNAAATIDHWDEVIKGAPTSSDAVHAIDALTPLIPKLSGPQRSNAIYIRMMAYGISGQDTELCKAVSDVLANDANATHKDIAQQASDARKCK
jgi:hypothetical protein